uniref:CPW-WPC domain-containing protein n=1 Tax=Theileria annulata TaxID=5874 RepID=A0A3B0N5P3_THEAN
MSFESYTPEEKVNWSNSCQANWPCKNENKDQECADSDRNYNQTCPLSFVKEVIIFISLTRCRNLRIQTIIYVSQQSCGTQWPCIRNCSFVFEDCPLDWIKDSNGSCSAPTSYKGSCDKKFYFTHYTQKMKLEYLKACDIAFECSNDCKRDYTKCPNNWTNNRNGICISPTYNELCFQTYSELIGLNTTDSTDKFNKILEDERKNKPEYRIIDLNRLSYENKVMFESKCPIANFPCIENSDYDWDKPCPQRFYYLHITELYTPQGVINWNYINSHCIPLYINEDDDCRTKKVFKSEEEKRKWSSFCQIPWPKFGESETIVTESKKKFMLSGPVIHESGAVNVSSNLKNKTNDQLKESDYSKSIKKLNRLQVTLT